jgi:CRP-like cAMP-binding protein
MFMRPSQPDSARARFGALRAVRELAACSDEQIWSLVRYADEVRLGAGHEVAQEGTPSAEFVVVMEGQLRARSCGASELLGSGAGYGWHEMWERSPNRATVTVEADARLLVMSHEQFRAVKALVNFARPQHNELGLGAVAVTRHVSSVSP